MKRAASYIYYPFSFFSFSGMRHYLPFVTYVSPVFLPLSMARIIPPKERERYLHFNFN